MTIAQYCIMSILSLYDECSGRHLRGWLNDNGLFYSLPSFYMMMAKFENMEYVKGYYASKEIEGETFNERRYYMTDKGSINWNNIKDSYFHIKEV